MGVFTFVLRNSDGEWTANQLSGGIEASGSSVFGLQRTLVSAVLAVDRSGPVQSSFSTVSPSSAVFQVTVGGAVVAGGGVAATCAPAAGGGAPAGEAAPAEKKKEEVEEEEDDDDLGLSLFD